jgi:hypothetical protein
MNRRDKKVYDIIDKITKEYNALSDEAKEFIASAIEENDIIDYLKAMLHYQRVIEDRLYIKDADETDYAILETLRALIKCFLEHADEFSIYYK